MNKNLTYSQYLLGGLQDLSTLYLDNVCYPFGGSYLIQPTLVPSGKQWRQRAFRHGP
jgi:hypothetical protein